MTNIPTSPNDPVNTDMLLVAEDVYKRQVYGNEVLR